MYTLRRRCAGVIPLGTILLTGLCVFRSSGAEGEFPALLTRAYLNNPALRALQERVAQFAAAYDATEGFLDPELSVGAGWAGEGMAIPGSSPALSLPGDAAVVESGVVVPLRWGLYLDMGAAARLLSDPEDDFQGDLYQTTVGSRLRVPLVRDRGFALWRADRVAGLAQWNEAAAELAEGMQQLRLEVERGYFGLIEANALVDVEKASSGRLERLLRETGELAEAKVVPAYQVSVARLEWQLSLEAVTRADQTVEQRLMRFTEVLGGGDPPTVAGSITSLVARAEQARVTPGVGFERIESLRGAFQVLGHRRRAVEAELTRAREEERADVSLEVGARWQAEDEDGPIGSTAILTEEEGAAEVLVVWRKTLHDRAARGEQQRLSRRLAELAQEHAALRLQVETEHRRAVADYEKNLARLRLLQAAIKEGLQTLEAERERFRLGEGRSRNVLDAEKDVTDATRLEVLVAAALLQAVADYRFATAYFEEYQSLESTNGIPEVSDD